VSFAFSTASASVSKAVRAAIGPKISSSHARIPGFTPVSTVGG
jgi:hypothetical protein